MARDICTAGTAPNKVYALRARPLRWVASSGLRGEDRYGCRTGCAFGTRSEPLRPHFGVAGAAIQIKSGFTQGDAKTSRKPNVV